jgi:hypothetical protein
LLSLEQQLVAEIGPPHNYVGLHKSFASSSSSAAAAAGDTFNAAGVIESVASQQQQHSHGCAAVSASGAAATALAAEAYKACVQGLLPDMVQLRNAAEVGGNHCSGLLNSIPLLSRCDEQHGGPNSHAAH